MSRVQRALSPRVCCMFVEVDVALISSPFLYTPHHCVIGAVPAVPAGAFFAQGTPIPLSNLAQVGQPDGLVLEQIAGWTLQHQLPRL